MMQLIQSCVHYLNVTVEEVARCAISMGRNSLAKIDITSAYRLIPVSPSDLTWLDVLETCICT